MSTVFSGTPAMTSRGLKEVDFEQIGRFLDTAIQITLDVQARYGKLLKDFNRGLEGNEAIHLLRSQVEEWSACFPMPGFDVSKLPMV